MGLAKNYLLAYNAALIFGWAFVLTVAAKVCVTIGPEHVYQNVEVPLLVAQTAAVMEVIHAIFGIARSPVIGHRDAGVVQADGGVGRPVHLSLIHI